MTFGELVGYGQRWLTEVNFQRDDNPCDANRIALAQGMNALLEPLGIRVGRGWQRRDPVVRCGRPHSYMALMEGAERAFFSVRGVRII